MLPALAFVLALCACCAAGQAQSDLPNAQALQLKNLKPGAYAWLLPYDGKPTSAIAADPRYAALKDGPLSILKAQFDLGDPVGGHTLVRDEIQSALLGVPDPVHTRLGRYVVLSGCRDNACASRAFVWVDTRDGIVLAVLLTPPTVEMPGTTPGLLLASRQLSVKQATLEQMPLAFQQDWADWAYSKHLPSVMTERVVSMFGGISVMFHDDAHLCDDTQNTMDAINCLQQASFAATADMDALLALLRRHMAGEQADSAQDIASLATQQAQWTAYRDTTCKAAYAEFDGGTEAPVAELECERSMAHDRASTLNGIYFMILYD